MSVLDCLRDQEAERCALAERAFVGALGGGCSSPTAAHAVVNGDSISITGMYMNENEQVLKQTISGPLPDGTALAIKLAKQLKEALPCPER